MPEYDDRWFTPPAPLARVVVRNPQTGASHPDVPLLIDSGADVTLIPAAVAKHLKLSVDPARRCELVGFDGTVSNAPMVQLEILFCGRLFRGQFLLIDQEWGVLGRNVLNAVALRLDGPRLAWIEAG